MNTDNILFLILLLFSFLVGFLGGFVVGFLIDKSQEKNDERYEGFKKLDGKLPKAPVPICQCGGTVPLTRKFKSK